MLQADAGSGAATSGYEKLRCCKTRWYQRQAPMLRWSTVDSVLQGASGGAATTVHQLLQGLNKKRCYTGRVELLILLATRATRVRRCCCQGWPAVPQVEAALLRVQVRRSYANIFSASDCSPELLFLVHAETKARGERERRKATWSGVHPRGKGENNFDRFLFLFIGPLILLPTNG
jgi:hypothetical protein